MDLKKRIENCKDLTPGEKKFALYLETHLSQLDSKTIRQLSLESCFSVSGIHRFCRKIGLKGFKELKKEGILEQFRSASEPIDINFPFDARDTASVIEENLYRLYKTTLRDTLENIHLRQLSLITGLLASAHHIDIYTHAHNSYPAGVFADRLTSIGKQVRLPQGSYNQRAAALSADSTHAALVISYSGKASFLPSVMEILKKKKCRIIFLGKPGAEKNWAGIKYHLSISDQENLQNRISQFSSHISLQYLLDLIFCCVFQADYNKNMDLLKANLTYLDDRFP